MKALLAVFLLLVSPLALAATFAVGSVVNAVIWLIIVGIILGLLIFLVRKAPFIPPEFKEFIVYGIYIIAILVLINFLLGLVGHPIVFFG